MIINNVEIYGLTESCIRAGYPMVTDIGTWKYDIQQRIESSGKLAKAKTGSGHDNFLKGIIVQFDLTFTLKAWTEAQRYHWFDFISSQSTMHRITRMDIGNCCNKYVWHQTIQMLELKSKHYNSLEDKSTKEAKELYLEILYNIPTGFQLTAGITTNYQQLKTMYHQRRHHRLPDWQMFCDWVETLPHSKWITGKSNE